MVDEWLHDGGEEAHEGEAYGSDGDIRGLDASVEEYPVDGEQDSASDNLQEVVPADFFQLVAHSHHEGEQQGTDDNAKHDKGQLADGDESPE